MYNNKKRPSNARPNKSKKFKKFRLNPSKGQCKMKSFYNPIKH